MRNGKKKMMPLLSRFTTCLLMSKTYVLPKACSKRPRLKASCPKRSVYQFFAKQSMPKHHGHKCPSLKGTWSKRSVPNVRVLIVETKTSRLYFTQPKRLDQNVGHSSKFQQKLKNDLWSFFQVLLGFPMFYLLLFNP